MPIEVVNESVEAARLTASAMNVQPWHFVIVVERESLQELGKLVKTGPYIAQAQAAVVAACDKATATAVSDISRAIQSMMLTAWDYKVGTNWTGFGGLEDVRKFVGLPDTYDVIGVVPFGDPKRLTGLGKKKRKPIEDVVSVEKFGAR